MKKFLLLTILLVHICQPALLCQGLKFNGQTYTIHERTALDVFALSKQTFKDKLDISFDFISYPAARFGYLLRMWDYRDKSQTWNISFDGRAAESVVIRLNEEGRRSIIQIEIDKAEYQDYVCIPVRLRFDATADSVYFSFGDKEAEERLEMPKSTFTPCINFGLSGHVVDVSSFAIKNLRVGDNRRTIHFPLDESDGNILHDSHGRKRGTATNPVWMMREARMWEHLSVLSSETPAGVAYDRERKSVIMYDRDQVRSYDLASGTAAERKTGCPCPINILLGTNFIKGDTLTAYELNDWKNNNTGVSIATLDLNTLVWTARSEDRLDGQMHHHGAFINPANGEYTFFGGFGNMYFNGDFIALGPDYRWKTVWDDSKGQRTLFPRFFCAAGLDDEGHYAYFFGGLGNESGEQVVGRRYFYDLHRVDVRTGECTKLWTLDQGGEDFVPARNLVIDGDSIYALCYPEYLTESVMHLYRFSIADGSYEVFADGISVNSDKVWCSSSLYLDRELSKFIVTASDVDDELRPKTDIYSLQYPPSTFIPPTWFARHRTMLIIMAIALLLAAMACVNYLLLRRARLRREADSYVKAQSDQRKKVFRQSIKPNAIYLFGEFTITDKDGNDISDTFSKQQRTLLLLLLRYAGTGLSSSRLSSILWPDKEESKVKNSRGVAINSLRKNLSRLDGVSVNFEDGAFWIKVEEPAYCDYTAISALSPDTCIDEMLCIISRGRFLQGMADPEFDSFKDQTESGMAPILAEEIARRYAAGQYRAAVEIADMIFAYDPLDEAALHYAVRSLMAIRRRDDALVRYASFTAEYQNTNNENYPIKFEKI